LASISNYHLLQINLFTGRHHQIRAQLSAIGCPIKGDLKYGFDRSNANASIHLHSFKTEFIHPIKLEKISVTCKPDITDVVWKELAKMV
jgi:23S rRNA pseudouridine1911/1915/1917 synthase